MSEESKETLPVNFESDDQQQVQVIDKAALKKAERKQMAKVYEQFNGRVMRLKMRLLAKNGAETEKLGVKHMGHGWVNLGGDFADRYIEIVEDQIGRLEARTPPVDPRAIVELRRLQLNYNKQILETGKLHLEAVKEAAGAAEKGLHIAFPAGQPVKVAIVSDGAALSGGVNDKEKQLTDETTGT